MAFRRIVPIFALALYSSVALAQHVHLTGRLQEPARVGSNRLIIELKDHAGQPVKDATVTVSLDMAEMRMGEKRPPVTNHGDGTYSANLDFTMQGTWRAIVTAKSPTAGEATTTLDFKTSGPMQTPMEMPAMRGRLNAWGMQKEGSGTSLLPESSPMHMLHLGRSGRFEQSGMGFVTYNFTDAGGPRGPERFYSNSMLMLMGVDAREKETTGYSVMLSLDPLFNGRFGAPNLFQTGETAYGEPLTDFQHPHDLFVEVAGTYSREIAPGTRAFVYGGPVGEPALGGPTFMHRPSGVEIPEAPIGHHWFDSTHISWGVLTLGVNTGRWQIEGSLFNGHEPDENRYAPDNVSLNSASARLTLTPHRDFAFNVAYGFLDEPEPLEPGVHQNRVTASAIWNRQMANGDNLAVSAAFGRNLKEGEATHAYLLETTYSTGPTSLFARWESVEKDEIQGVPDGTYRINKFLVGGVQELAKFDGLDFGIGGYVGFYMFPSSLEPFYGENPMTFGVFVRLRPSRMTTTSHGHH